MLQDGQNVLNYKHSKERRGGSCTWTVQNLLILQSEGLPFALIHLLSSNLIYFDMFEHGITDSF